MKTSEMNTPTAMKTKKVSVTKSVPKKGVSSSKRLTMVKQAISMKMAFSGEKDKIKISADKVTIIRGDIKEEVYMFRFDDKFMCPLDGMIYYVTKRASAEEKLNVFRRSLLDLNEYTDFKFILNIKVSVDKQLVVAEGWILHDLVTFFSGSNKYMRETKYPNAHGIFVPTYALSSDTREYLRFQYLKKNLGEFCTFDVIG